MYYYLHYCCLAQFLYFFSQCLQTSRALIYIRFVPILLRLGKWSSSRKFGLELGFQCNCSPLRPGLRHWSSSRRFGRGLLLQVELKPWEQTLTSNSNFQHTQNLKLPSWLPHLMATIQNMLNRYCWAS